MPTRHPSDAGDADLVAASYRMPAEWEPHAATWLAWPHYRNDWPGKFEPIFWVYAEIIRNLARHERVELIVKNAAAEKQAKKVLERANALAKNVRFHRRTTDRVWTRDSGCSFVTKDTAVPGRPESRRSLGAVQWRFNAWAKYSNWKKDQLIGEFMAKASRAQAIKPVFGKSPVVLEGGSIDSNGRGSLLTTEECLLSTEQQRNPGMGREDYEKVFHDYLGIHNVIWLGRGIVGDDTHGHVDDLSRFVSPDTVVTMIERNPRDPNHEPLEKNLGRLRTATDQDGKPLNVVEMPMPGPVVFERRRLPASYANFYIANRLVLVPVFNDPNDRLALNILCDVFPGREVVPIYSGDLIWGFGAMHCMTQQEPVVAR